MHDINSMSRRNALAQNRHNSLPCTVRTSRQRSCNQRVGCLQWLGPRALGPAKQSDPRLSLASRPLAQELRNYSKTSQVIFGKHITII